MRFFNLIIFLLLSFSFFAQTSRVRFDLTSTGVPCETVLKEVAIYSTEDSLIFRDQSDTCSFVLKLAANTTFELRIRSQLYQPITLSFTTPEDTAQLIDLGTLTLRESVSELDEVTITGIQKRFIQIDAEKTTVTVTDNPVLEISSVYDAILKIPGVVPFPGGGFALGGQMATIQFDGIPSNLGTTDLMNLLKSMPANSVTSIELITNPGASYDATISGSIINLLSQGIVTKWFSCTVSMNYGLNQNNKLSPSVLVSGKGKKFTWQVQSGMSYNERTNKSETNREYTSFSPQASLLSSRKEQSTSRYAYFAPSITYRFSKKALLTARYGFSGSLNTALGRTNSGSEGIDTSINLLSDYRTRGTSNYHNLNVRYKHFFDTLDRTLTIQLYSGLGNSGSNRETDQLLDTTTTYSLIRSKSNFSYLVGRADLEIPWKKIKFTWNAGLKYSFEEHGNNGQYNLQSLDRSIYQSDLFPYAIHFKYREDNMAAYTELKKGFGKNFSVTAGLRVENYNLSFRNAQDSLISRNYLNAFPSVHAMYRITPDIRFITSYSRKINMPSASQFDPNISGYYDSYSTSTGNSQLKPNFYNQGQAKLTIFDYMELSVNVSHANSLVLNEVSVDPNSLITNSTYRTYSNVTTVSYFMSLPVPFGIFTKGMAFFEENIDIDAISFLYLYADCNKTNVPGYNYLNGNKALWTYGVYSQFILPGKVRMNVDFSYTAKGTYQLYNMVRPNSGLEVVFSREFKDRKWRASLSFQDIFNQTQNTVLVAYPYLNLRSYSKNDTRIAWFKLSYTFGKVDKSDSGLNLPSKPDVGVGL